jgi:hypothetical protein
LAESSWRSGLAERVGGASWRSELAERVGGVSWRSELTLVAAHRVDGHGTMPLEFANVGWLLSRPSRCGSEWLGTGAGQSWCETRLTGCLAALERVVVGSVQRTGGTSPTLHSSCRWRRGRAVRGWRSGLAESGWRSRVGVGRGSPRRWARSDAAGVRECRMAFKPSVPLRVRVAWDRCGAEVGAKRG